MTIAEWVYLWAFYAVLLICISIFVQVPYCLDFCNFVVECEVREPDSSSFILLSQDCFGYSGSSVFSCWVSRFQVKQTVLRNWWLDDSSQLKSLREKAEKKILLPDCLQSQFYSINSCWISSLLACAAHFRLVSSLVLKNSSKSSPPPTPHR